MARLRIQELAIERGLSMHKLSRLSDVNISTISKLYHNPDDDKVTLSTLNKIAGALGVPVSALFADESMREGETE